MTETLILTPAYGRDYRNQSDALRGWDAQRDFIIRNVSHPYCGKPVNKQQLPAGTKVIIRFNQMRSSVNALA